MNNYTCMYCDDETSLTCPYHGMNEERDSKESARKVRKAAPRMLEALKEIAAFYPKNNAGSNLIPDIAQAAIDAAEGKGEEK